MEPRRLLIVEDEPLMASLLADALKAAGFATMVAEDVASARTLVDSFDPDLVLLDIGLGDGPTGVHLAHALRRSRPDIALLMLTQHPDPGAASGGMALPPAVGFLRKHLVSDLPILLDAIEAALNDRGDEFRQDGPVSTAAPLLLGEQPMLVLELLAKGYDNAGIASRTGLSEKSVERWVRHIYEVLDIPTRDEVNPRVEAARRYIALRGLPDRQK